MAPSASVDFTKFVKKGEKPKKLVDSGVFKRRWWLLDGENAAEEIADSIGATIKAYQDKQSGRIWQLRVAARLYGNMRLMGLPGNLSGTRSMAPLPFAKERITDNITQSVIDTASARIGENKPRPYFLTSGGTYKQQRKAKKLNQFQEGIFFENKAYELGGGAQRDCEIFGDGFLHVFERAKRICFERVLSAELWIDEEEGAYDKPRQMHWVRPVDRELLYAWVEDSETLTKEEKAKALAAVVEADRANTSDASVSGTQSDMVMVRESWHLRSSEDSKDGKHCISVDGALLEPLSDWNHDFFPFARFQWSPRPLGYWGQGLAEQLMPKQLEINKLLAVIQRSMHLAGTYKVFLEMGSKIVKEHITNDIGSIVEYRGNEPKWFVPNVVPMEYYQHYKDLKLSCYEQAGVSLQSATGQKPAGLNSGEAQRVYRDTVSERLKTQERLNERAFMDLAEIAIAMARDIAVREGSYEVRAPSGRILKAIRMTAEDLDPSGWEQQCFPTSSLPKDPAGRLQTIQEYVQAGFMTPRQARRALDFPDLEAVESLANAAEDLIVMVLDGICDEGGYLPPEPTDDLHLAMEMVVEYINRGRTQELEEERLDLLRTYKAQLDALMQAAQPPPPMGAPGMGPPQAAPMAPPQSNLIPNAPGMQAAA